MRETGSAAGREIWRRVNFRNKRATLQITATIVPMNMMTKSSTRDARAEPVYALELIRQRTRRQRLPHGDVLRERG